MKKVGIIGGGIVGMCSAWYLRQAGHEVTIIDQGDMQSGCSWGNAGMIVPSHFIPLSAPGMISKGIRWMFNPQSPFYVRPRLDGALLKWGWNFYRHANHACVEKSAPSLRDLSLYSKQCYKELSSSISFDLFGRGLLMLYRKKETGDEEVETAHMANRLGVEAKILSLKEVQALEPGVEITALGGIYFPGDMHLTPSDLMNALHKRLIESNVRLLPNNKVIDIDVTGRTVTALRTADQSLKFDEVVIAAGSWSPGVAKR